MIALLNTVDQYREVALYWNEIVEDAQIPLLTTEFCVLEVVDALSKPQHRAIAREFVDKLRGGALVTIEPCSSNLIDRGLALHAGRDDKEWGLTDCINLVVMEDYGVDDVLTFDHHFIEAGKRALPL